MIQHVADTMSTVCFAIPDSETKQQDITCVLRKKSSRCKAASSRQISPETSFADYSAEELPDLALVVRTLFSVLRTPRKSAKHAPSSPYIDCTSSDKVQKASRDAPEHNAVDAHYKLPECDMQDERSVLLKSIARFWLSLSEKCI